MKTTYETACKINDRQFNIVLDALRTMTLARESAYAGEFTFDINETRALMDECLATLNNLATDMASSGMELYDAEYGRPLAEK